MTIKVNKYAECSGIIDICYKSHTELNDAFGNCPNNFCFLGIDVSTQSSQWGKGAVQGSSMLFMISREERCQPETKEGRHTYKFLDVPRNCEVEIVGATDPKTTEEPTTSTTTEKSKTTTTNVEKSSANVTIIIVCGVLGLLLVLLDIGLIIFFTVVKPRWAASRMRRQPIVAAEAGESHALIPTKASKAIKASKTPSATPVKAATKAKSVPTAIKDREATPAPTSENKKLQTEKTTMEEQPPEAAIIPIQGVPSTTGFNEDPTQDSPTGTEGTPPVNHQEANSMKRKSIFKAHHWIPRKQTNVPYRKKQRLDSLEQLVPTAESVLATLERNERISKTVQMTVASQWRLDVPHVMTKLEKSILRDVVDVALDSVAELILEIDNDLIALHAGYLENDSSPIARDFVNQPDTPASAGYRLLAMSYPLILDDIQPSLEDPLIREMSVPGLYMLLISSHFQRDFKAKLLKEMRERATQLLKEVPCNNLANSPYPLPYMSRRYAKDRINFVNGMPKKSKEKQ
uniref:Transmembrane protein n=1 Tax=Panagrellus redivivus TaxID=6233 RepID=A0A7E4WB99_PANRE